MYATGYKTRKAFTNKGTTTQNQGIKWNAFYDGSKANVDIDLVDNNNTRHYSATLNDRQFATLYNDVLLQPVNPIPLEQRLMNDFNISPRQPPLLLKGPSQTHRRRRHKHRKRQTQRNSKPPKAKSPVIYTPPTPIYT